MTLSGSGKIGITRFLIGVLMFVSWVHSTIAQAQQATRFTVADEIGLTLFDDPSGAPAKVLFSPDGSYFAVWNERGRSDLNRPEDSLRFYRVRDVEDFLQHPGSQPPSPIWVLTLCTDTEGPVIMKWRWLADSTGVGFLERVEGGNQRLVLAHIRNNTTETLTPQNETVRDFDIRDREHYVYLVADTAPRDKLRAERESPSIAGS